MELIRARISDLCYNQIVSFLGGRRKMMGEQTEKMISECSEEIVKLSRPRVIYKILPAKDGNIPDFPIPGENIKKLLSGCSAAVMMAATIGTEPVSYVERLRVLDIGRAFICDACASAAVENVCDNFENDLREALRAEGCALTRRFSPGYGDMPLDIQPDFIAFLDAARRIGITVTDSYLMLPQKSVTAVMGIRQMPETKK